MVKFKFFQIIFNPIKSGGRSKVGSWSVELINSRKAFFQMLYKDEKFVWNSKTDTFPDWGVHVTQVS